MNEREGGFTLIEIVMVLLILAVVAAVALPAVSSLGQPGDSLDAGIEELTSILANARRIALDRGVSVEVLFDPASRRYWMETESGTELVADRELSLPPEIRWLGPSPGRFRFDRLGSAHGPIIDLEGDSGRWARISVDRWTGARVVERGRAVSR